MVESQINDSDAVVLEYVESTGIFYSSLGYSVQGYSVIILAIRANKQKASLTLNFVS